jgi:deoxyhypusine monooxygenase
VRHEAAEALGAIGTEDCLHPLRTHEDDPCLEVAQTCQLALQRIAHYQTQAASSAAAVAGQEGMEGASPYLSVDPAPAAHAAIPVEELKECLLDEQEKIFER